MKLASRSRSGGFTFVELMATLAIMAMLLTVAVPMVQLMLQRQKEHALRLALEQIRTALDAYKLAVEQGSIEVAPGESGYPKSLEQLVEGVDNQRNPKKSKLRFLRRVPPDPMSDADASVPASRTWGLRSHASPAEAPSAGDDVFDVYSLSGKTGLNGVPYARW